MTNLLALIPTLQLFGPVLVAAVFALSLLITFRVAATRKLARALEANASWAPPVPAVGEHPLNQVRPRITLRELLSPSQAAFPLNHIDLDLPDSAASEPSPADSCEITRPFVRV